MTRRTLPWHRLLPRHHRLLVWWALAGAGIALPWLIDGGGLPWLHSRADTPGCRVTSIHDGDSIRATCADGNNIRVRLACIDAPEMQQTPWGTESRDHLRAITPQVVSLRISTTDRYGRTIAELIDPATGESLNLAMVKVGQAAVYHQYCSDSAYSRAEAAARAAGLGIWSVPGDHQRPWDWRRR